MQNATTSTIAQLFFSKPPVFNFARLVADLDEGLSQCPCYERKLTWDHDDIAIFDLEGSRITVSHNDDLAGQYTSCLNLSVEYADALDKDSPIGRRQSAVARMMADRISDCLPPDKVKWLESDDVVTSDILDGLVDMMPGTTYTPKHAPSVTPIKKPSMAPVDVERILQELEERLEKPVPAKAKPNKSPFARLSGLKRPRLNLTMPGSMSNKARIEVANDLPDLPQPMLGEAQMIRQALYNKKAGSNHHSTELRLATHALNVTVLVIALPVGALMMAYSIVRGENIHASARMLAIVGMFAGLQVTPVGAQIMSMI